MSCSFLSSEENDNDDNGNGILFYRMLVKASLNLYGIPYPANIYRFKVSNNKNWKKVSNMFKVNNKGTRTTLFQCLYQTSKFPSKLQFQRHTGLMLGKCESKSLRKGHN